jgi:iron complex transport system substrate-binding protein
MRKASLIVSILFCFACSVYAVSFNRLIYPVKTKDASGYVLEQGQAPMRIISTSPTITEILFEFNLKDRIVGITENCNYPDGVKDIQKVGKDKLDTGKAVSLKPDLILVRLDEKNADIEKLRSKKFTVMVSDEANEGSIEVKEMTIEVFAVSPQSMSDIFKNIGIIGTVTNREHAAYSLTQKMGRKIDWVEARARNDKKFRTMKVLVVVSKNPLMVATNGNYLSDMANSAGLVNVAPKGDGKVKMSRKEIEKEDPDIIITSTELARDAGDICGNRNFRKTNAGKQKRAVCIDTDIFSRPGPRVTTALEQIAVYAYGWETKNEQQNDQQAE